MANEILEGIKQAVSNGEPVQKVIRSFINAGYPVDEINKAVAMVNQSFQVIQQETTIPITSLPKPPMNFKPIQVPNYVQPKIQQVPEASAYIPQGHKEVGNGMIMIMIVVLLLLLGILGVVVLFKDQLLALIG